MTRRPLIAHVLYRLDTGGMERVVVALINATGSRYRHAVVCLAGCGALRGDIRDPDVPCLSLHKRPGKDWLCHVRLWRALRQLQPDLVASYNIGALDVAPVARLAGVRRVVHAEHGRESADPHGRSRRYRRLRRCMAPFITRFVAVSDDLDAWLRADIGIAPAKVLRIPNGIDTERCRPGAEPPCARPLLGAFAPPGTVLIATVGRLDAVKDQASLLTAFRLLCDEGPAPRARLRLVIIGEGRERARLEELVAKWDLGDRVRLLGNRVDVPELLAECDIFALSSIAEGMPLTVLEAMAAGLPVVATDVGGVREVVVPERTGTLVVASDPASLAATLDPYLRDTSLRQRHGRAGRERVEKHFSLPAMVSAYTALYDELLADASASRATQHTVVSAKPGER